MKCLSSNYLKLLLSLFLVLTVTIIHAQKIVTGIVKDMEEATLPGVNVTLKETTTGTITNANGQYSIKVPGNDAVLVFSFVGYTKEEIKVGDRTTIDVIMMPDIESLSEVMVIGYGTMKKEDKTGAVSQVTTEEMQGGVLTDAVQAIQGRSAGVMVTKKGGDPNAGFSIKIRGASGFDSNTQPLYVVDGVPGVDPSTVAPEDIKTFDILKDAASTAIYGSQGSNGVVIITTKKGQSNKKGGEFVSNVNYNSKISVDNVANRYDMLTANELRSHVQNVAENNNTEVDEIFNDGGTSTNWQDEIFRTGITHSNNISFSGGNQNNSYYASVTHADWEGVMQGTSKKRTIGKMNVVHKGMDDKLTMTGSISGTLEENDYESYSGYGRDDIIYQALSRNPTDPVYNDDGSYYESNRVFNYQNPIAIINEIDNDRVAKRFYSSLKTDFEIFEGLKATSKLAYTKDDNVSSFFRPKGLYPSGDPSVAGNPGYARKGYDNYEQKLLELTGTYDKTFNEQHHINLLGGYSWQGKSYNGFYAQAKDATSEFLGYNHLQQFNDVVYGDVGSYKGSSTLIGFFSRLQYNFQQKYYISGSVRRDGSSKFGENNKWGWFPTAAMGWKLNKESFLENAAWMDLLKLRFSWGISGNQAIGEYRSLTPFQTSGTAINPLTNEYVVTYSPAWNSNPDLQWEETTEINGGVDFAFFNDRISGSIDAYQKVTTDLLGQYAVPVPPNLSRTTFANSGKMQNTGVELYVRAYAVDRPNFKWETNLNVSHNKTILLDLGEYIETDVRKEGYITGRGLIGDFNYVTGIQEGEEIGSFYLPQYVTILDGEFVYRSTTGGYTTNLEEAKRAVVGTAAPDVEIGWSSTFTFYNNWVVDFSFRSMIGNDVYNATEMFFDYPGNLPSLNATSSALDWYEKDRNTSPKISDEYVEDASFLRMDFASIGYQFNLDNVKWMQKLKIYVASNNLFVLTGYSGIDPETTVDGLAFGIDQYNVYPKTRTFTFGVNATF